MLDLIWLVPITLIIAVGMYGAYRAFRHPSGSHDRAEILSGFGVMLLCAGMVKIGIEIGDWVATLLILAGMFVSVIYGIEHIFARRKERK